MRHARGRLALAIAAIAVAIAVAIPAPAAGWKWVFQDFNIAGGGSGAAAFRAVAKKCKGGKLGFYDFVNRAAVVNPTFELHYEVTADMPVFSKFRQMKKVEFTAETSGNIDPNVVAEIVRAYGDFYEGIFARYVQKKNRIIFRHQGIVLFGQQSLAPGEHVEPFKPKRGC
jgi:hypothetical protein